MPLPAQEPPPAEQPVQEVQVPAGATEGAPVARAADGDPLAMLNGTPILEDDLSRDGEWWNLQRQVYEARRKAIESAIATRLVNQEARRRGVPAAEMIETEIAPKVGEPTSKEINDFYKEQQVERPLKEVRDAIIAELKRRKSGIHLADFIQGLWSQADVEMLVEPPRLPVSIEGARTRGPEDAPITLVEYSDFQCPYCRRVQPVLAELLTEYEDRVRWAFKDLPLTEIHPEAIRAAHAARCADDQGKFWEFRQSLFGEELLTDGTYTEIAKALKLNAEDLLECLDSGKHLPAIEIDASEARGFGLSGTPAFLVNGILLSGALPIESFRELIDSELARMDGESQHSASP